MIETELNATDKITAALHAGRREKTPYKVAVLNKDFIVFPGVFSPKYCVDTAFYSENLPICRDDRLLEIGCGTGIVSICALLKGAGLAVAVDINPSAVRNSVENATRHNVSDKMQVRLGDVYDVIKPGERFDLIFWNLPFGYSDRSDIGLDEMAFFDAEYKAFKRFIFGSKDHLKKNGRLLFGCCPALARFDLIVETLASMALSYSVLARLNTANLNETITFQLLEAHSS